MKSNVRSLKIGHNWPYRSVFVHKTINYNNYGDFWRFLVKNYGFMLARFLILHENRARSIRARNTIRFYARFPTLVEGRLMTLWLSYDNVIHHYDVKVTVTHIIWPIFMNVSIDLQYESYYNRMYHYESSI